MDPAELKLLLIDQVFTCAKEVALEFWPSYNVFTAELIRLRPRVAAVLIC